MNSKSFFTFEMPLSVKNKLIAVSAIRKQKGLPNATIKAILLECIEKGLQSVETDKSNVQSTENGA